MVSRRFMTDTVTVWVPTQGDPDDPYDDGGWNRSTMPCTYAQGGKTQTDDSGAEFQPQETYYTATKIPRGAKVVIGDVPGVTPAPEANAIRKVDTWTPMRGQARDYVQYTG